MDSRKSKRAVVSLLGWACTLYLRTASCPINSIEYDEFELKGDIQEYDNLVIVKSFQIIIRT